MRERHRPRRSGSIVYTQLLNRRGGIECDFTVTRVAADRFLLVTGTAVRQPRRGLAPPAPAGATAACGPARHHLGRGSCFGLWGPRARDILAPLTRDDLSNAGFPYLTAREITVGDVPVLALRVTYVGELGWELYAPTEYGRALWATLWDAGRPHGMVAGGYRAIDALRLEKGYRVWSSDITPDETPYEAGLGFAVALDKEPSSSGATRSSPRRPPARASGCAASSSTTRARSASATSRSGVGGAIVGRVTSGGYGFAVERSIAYAYLPPDGGDRHARRGRGLRRVDRLRGRPRAAVGPEGRRIRA